MDKKDIIETAADAAKVVVGIAAMAVDALAGADRPETDASDQQPGKAREEQNRAEMPKPGGGESGGEGAAPISGESSPDDTSAEARSSTGAININQAKFDELVSLKHIGRGSAKRIMASRPFRSVEDLASRGIVPADVLAILCSRLAV